MVRRSSSSQDTDPSPHAGCHGNKPVGAEPTGLSRRGPSVRLGGEQFQVCAGGATVGVDLPARPAHPLGVAEWASLEGARYPSREPAGALAGVLDEAWFQSHRTALGAPYVVHSGSLVSRCGHWPSGPAPDVFVVHHGVVFVVDPLRLRPRRRPGRLARRGSVSVSPQWSQPPTSCSRRTGARACCERAVSWPTITRTTVTMSGSST